MATFIFRVIGFVLAFSYVHSSCNLDVNNQIVCIHSTEREFTTLAENLKVDVTGIFFVSVRMGRISKEMFNYPHLKAASALTMRDMMFDGFEDDTFEGFNNLIILAIIDNYGLVPITAGTFRGATKLININMRDVSLSGIDVGSFIGMSSLNYLTIRDENLDTVRTANFLGLSGLKELVLRSTKINNIEPGAFTGLGSLQKLSLQSNDLTYIREGAFSGLLNLEYLDLSRNVFETLNYTVFEGLNNVHTLDLSFTGIKEVDRQELERYMPKLDKVIIT